MATPVTLEFLQSWCLATRKAMGIALMAFSAFAAMAQTPGTMTVGHPTGRCVTYKRVSSSLPSGAAVSLSEEQLKAFAGCYISGVQIELSEAVSPDSLTVFLTRSLDEESLFEMHPDTTKDGVNEIALSTPYLIEEGTELIVGYTLSGVKNLCYANTLATGKEWIRNKSDNQWHEYDNSSYSACITLTVEGGILPEDVRLSQFTMPEYNLTAQPVTYEGEIVNLGASTVSELQCTYYVDGEKALVENVDGLDIAPRTKGTFSLSSLSFPTECETTVQVELSAVNGKADALPSDNWSRSQSLVCRDEFVKRKVLMEVFSTERCTNCPSAHEYLDGLFEGKDNLIEVGHHSGFYTDSLTIPASTDYEWFYKPGRLYAPALMFDRTNRSTAFPKAYSDSVPVINAVSQYVLPIYEAAAATPVEVSVILHADYDETTRHLALSASGSQLLPLAHPEQARLFVVLTEDSVFSTTQAGASKGFYHRHAARKMLSATWGDTINLVNSYSASYECDIPQEWDTRKMRAVAFVACYDENDRNNCRVLGAEAVPLATGLPLSMSQTGAEYVPQLLQTANTLTLAGEGTFSLFSMSGCCIARGVRAMSRPLPGMYVVVIATPQGFQSTKIVL